MFKAAWKSLMGRKLRLLMSTFAIVLGVAFVAGSLIFTDTLSRSFDAIFASSVGDVVVRPVGGTSADGTPTTKTLPAALVDKLATVDGAARADGNVSSFSVFVVGTNNKVVGGQGAPGIGLSWTGAPAANGLEGLRITAGREPTAAGEIALDAGTAETGGYHVGDTVRLVTSTKQALLTPTLVGIASFAEGGSTNGATLTIFDTKTAQDLFLGGKDAFNDAWVTADGVSQKELRDNVAKVLPDGYEAVTGDQAADEAASDLMKAISFISTFLLIFAGISLVVGSFLIVNTFSILVAQRSRELALLRAIGASRRQVTRSVLFEAMVLGFAGATIGLGLGVLLAMGIRALFATFGLDLSGQSLIFEPRTAVAAYVVGIVVTVAAAYIPARRSARIPPVAALRDDVAMPESALHWRMGAGAVLIVAGGAIMLSGLYADVPGSPGWWVGGGILAVLLGVAAAAPVISRPVVALATVLYRRVYGTVGNLAGQNSLRNPRRTAATASALMIGLALVTTMSILGSSAKASVDKSIKENFYGDLVVSNVIGQPFSTSIADDIAKVPGVETVSRMRYANMSFDNDGGDGVVGVEPGTLTKVAAVPMVEGSMSDLRDGTVAVNESTAKDKGVGVGDHVELAFPTGTKSYEVVGVYRDNDPVLWLPYATTLKTLEAGGFPPADSYLLINVDDAANAAVVQDAVEKQTSDLPTVTVKDQAGFAEEQRAPIDQMLLLIYALLGLALVIAVLGIVNTLALSVIERTREIGLLRAIGLGRGQLRRMIRLEAIVIAVLGAVLGVGMGIVFGLALMTSLADEGLEVVKVPGGQLALYVVAAGLVGVLAAVFPARRAARLDVLRAIATE
jgi:putative ABC transport system permease protein